MNLKEQPLFPEYPPVEKSTKVAIFGKGERKTTLREVKNLGYDIWTVGTFEDREDSLVDRFFEWHDLEFRNRPMYREYPSYLYKYPLPLNNSICNMLVIAKEEGYKDVIIIGCPMDTKEEYVKEKPALIYCIGYLNALGMNIRYDQIPTSINYGRKK